jgi:hypothetical protein
MSGKVFLKKFHAKAQRKAEERKGVEAFLASFGFSFAPLREIVFRVNKNSAEGICPSTEFELYPIARVSKLSRTAH